MMSVSIYPILGDVRGSVPSGYKVSIRAGRTPHCCSAPRLPAQVYGFTAEQMSIITLVLSFIALLPPAIAAVLSRYMADREIMTLGLVLKTIGAHSRHYGSMAAF